MSIALSNRIKELERQVRESAERFDPEHLAAFMKDVEKRLTALENRPKPGRPPKNG